MSLCTVNAKVTKFAITRTEANSFGLWLLLDYGNDLVQTAGKEVMSDVVADLNEFFDVFKLSEIGQIVGQIVRVVRDGEGPIHKIGHVFEDKWIEIPVPKLSQST